MSLMMSPSSMSRRGLAPTIDEVVRFDLRLM